MSLKCLNEKCGAETPRIIAAKDGFFCPSCYRAEPSNNIGAMHQIKFNKWGTRMTIADAMRIKTNAKRSDGRFRPDPRWRTSGD